MLTVVLASLTTLVFSHIDSLSTPSPVVEKQRPAFLRSLYRFVKDFSSVDTTYVEPQRYNFTAMLQNTNTFEIYTLGYDDGPSIRFAPQPSIRLGPYFGWRWIFLGYTIDLTHLKGGDTKQDWSLSLYSNQVGVDFFYRKSGDSYRIADIELKSMSNVDALRGADFRGVHSSVVGGNLYYIFNHRRFSYPAAYSQTNIQRRSAGSPLIGIGYTHHTLSIDWDALRTLVAQRMGEKEAAQMPAELGTSRIGYTDVSLSAGYAYNWVFAYGWLCNLSLSGALAYKQASSGDSEQVSSVFSKFNLRNFNFDGVARLGVIYNTMRWYAGASSIFHMYNYHRKPFSISNSFGYVNFYIGYNFGLR